MGSGLVWVCSILCRKETLAPLQGPAASLGHTSEIWARQRTERNLFVGLNQPWVKRLGGFCEGYLAQLTGEEVTGEERPKLASRAMPRNERIVVY